MTILRDVFLALNGLFVGLNATSLAAGSTNPAFTGFALAVSVCACLFMILFPAILRQMDKA